MSSRADALDRGGVRPGEAGVALVAPPLRRPPPVPRVSVVVATCGRPDLLVRCLDALCAQAFEPGSFEIVVVDDGHCNATRTLVLTLAAEVAAPVVRYLRPPARRRGPAQARNLGWLSASGDIIAFTDDDTVPATDWIERGEAALCGARAEDGQCFVAMAGRIIVPPGAQAPSDHERLAQGLKRTEFVTANAFVQRAALLEVGGFDERFTRAWREDSDLQFTLQHKAGPVGRCEDAVVLHPAPRERWGVSLRQQKNAFFEALLYTKHPREYRERIGLPTPWDFYAIVALSAAALALWGAGIGGSAIVSAVIAAGLVLRFALRRLRGASKRLAHVIEMLATSALIPFLSVYWRLRGALHFRVWFL